MDDVTDLEALVGQWMPLPDVADLLGIEVGKVRRLVQDRDLLAVRVGERRILSVPAAFVEGGVLLPELRGTLVVLGDAGFSDEEAVRWLFTADDTLLGVTPVGALRAGHKTEVRRRAQAMAF